MELSPQTIGSDSFDGVLDFIHADSFRLRWKGLRPRACGRRMLFRASSVHGLGMRESLWAVGLDAGGVVIDARRLDPWRVVWIRGATWILELPIDEKPPRPGEIMVLGFW